ncbi:MAG: hypothetical protein HW404_2223 [Anaerolineales bacterium]|nr:hypothetical protein [Anaerolineales bacterium]
MAEARPGGVVDPKEPAVFLDGRRHHCRAVALLVVGADLVAGSKGIWEGEDDHRVVERLRLDDLIEDNLARLLEGLGTRGRGTGGKDEEEDGGQ